MSRVSWRAPDDLVDRVRAAARRRGQILNEFMTYVLDAATAPELASDEASRVRERLAAAGLLTRPARQSERTDAAAVAAARGRAGNGTPLSEIISAVR